MCCDTSRIVLLILLSLIIQKSEPKCFISYKYNNCACDSINDWLGTKNLPARVYIRATNGKFEELSVVPFENAKNVQILYLISVVNNINQGAFQNFQNIQFLNIYSNKLDEIPRGVFKDLKVEVLDLFNNSIKQIAPFAFENLTNLKSLKISSNKLITVPTNIFNDLIIKEFRLSDNQISDIENSAFGNMQNLEILYLSINHLSTFNVHEHLDYPEKLRTLSLDSNKIAEITVYMLEGLENLENLYLGFNSIRNIEPKAFAETPKLTSLDLAHNSLKTVSGNILPSSGLLNLKSLSLNDNRFTYLSSDFLFRLKDLRTINIEGNPWQCSCLNLILRWLHDKDVNLKWEKAYINGERPVCVNLDFQNICVYSYNEKHYKLYQFHNALYSPLLPEFSEPKIQLIRLY